MAVRTEVSALTGTADVTPLLALWVFLLLERSAFLSILAGIDHRG
ncbi:MAG: hypothetical protein ABUK16_07075 [Anaerolineales bacterium]